MIEGKTMERRRTSYVQEQLKNSPMWLVAVILVIGTVNQSDHNNLIRDQIEQIHESQIMQIREGRKFEERITDKTNQLNLRIAQLEVRDEMWEMPIYKDKVGTTYVDGRKQ
jgi:hypothetical protein